MRKSLLTPKLVDTVCYFIKNVSIQGFSSTTFLSGREVYLLEQNIDY